MTAGGESRRLFFSGPGCVCTRAWQTDTLNCSSFVDSATLLTSLASNGAVYVRGGVMKFRLVVDIVTTVHAVHTYTVAVSPSVLIKCSICSGHAPHERLKKTMHGI